MYNKNSGQSKIMNTFLNYCLKGGTQLMANDYAMKIQFADSQTETIISYKYFKENNKWYLREFIAVDDVPIGTFIMDFMSTDFMSKDSFLVFIEKWGIAGFINEINIVKDLIKKNRVLTNDEYEEMINTMFLFELRTALTSVQNDELYWTIRYCLDDDAPPMWENLSSIQRYFVFQDYYIKEFPVISQGLKYVQKRIRAVPVDEFFNEKYKNSLYQRSLSEASKARSEVIRQTEFKLVEELISNNFFTICMSEVLELIKNELPARKCRNCGRYFIPYSRVDTTYCDRIVDDKGRTCKDVGPMNNYLKKTKDHPVMHLYRKAYKKMHSRLKAKGDKQITKDVLDRWRLEAERKRDAVLNKEIGIDEFARWINEEGDYYGR